jgi:hypothetical protein
VLLIEAKESVYPRVAQRLLGRFQIPPAPAARASSGSSA